MKSTILCTDSIYEAINSSTMTPKQKVNSLLFIESILLNHSINHSWINISQQKMIKNFGSKYHLWFYKLKDMGILIANKTPEGEESYKYTSKEVKQGKVKDNKPWIKPFCKQYKINHIYRTEILGYTGILGLIQDRGQFKGNRKFTTFSDIICPILPFTKSSTLSQIPAPFIFNVFPFMEEAMVADLESYTLNNLKCLKFNIDKLKEVNERLVSEFSYKINLDINANVVYAKFIDFNKGKVSSSKKKYRVNIKKIMEKGNSVVEINNKFYVTYLPKDFCAYRKNKLEFIYKNQIEKLESKDFFAARNLTNNRLDNNLTNIASPITNEIIKENDLCQLDLKNSQFAILANHLLNEGVITEDNIFYQKATGGDLYEFMMEELELKNRGYSKTMLFELFFSKNKAFAKTKKKLALIFPEVTAYIYKYKTENESNQFAIMLQKKESEIFIDKILNRLKKENVWAITKHDSVICNKSEVNNVYNIIQEEFDKINFKGQLKID